ncbi:hypothetical protein M758_10G082500 [Ceratodon purpureus]|nr:hypothetical protein M758_10G082500 [Ceratodon purpureus]
MRDESFRMYHRIRDTGQPLSMRTKVTILHNPEEAFSKYQNWY